MPPVEITRMHIPPTIISKSLEGFTMTETATDMIGRWMNALAVSLFVEEGNDR